MFKPALLASAALIKEPSIKPAVPAQKPEKMYTANKTAVTLIPAYLAALALIPTDWIIRPIEVRLSKKITKHTIASAINIAVGNITPGILPPM